MPPKLTIKNKAEFARQLRKLDTVTQANVLETAVKAGLLPIQNEAVRNAPYLTGNYKRSIHTEILVARKGYCEGATGTNVEYGPRLEFGYNDTDSLGREYHQPAQPHFRPAFDNKRGEAVAEMGDVLKEILTRLV